MKAKHFFIALVIFFVGSANAQVQGPWQMPLIICESNDGINFSNCETFQDSSGVPSAIRWKGDTLVAVFQWFPEPFQANPSWDKVAVKFSYDGGANWTYPVSINVSGLPGNFQRPFDPTLLAINADSIRLYFSDGPLMNFDSSITTYSAVSTDGINYQYEQGKRFVSGDALAVIDPAVIYYKGIFHFQSHKGAPQNGSYHGTSTDGLNFTRVADIFSDMNHNWLGNFIIIDTTLYFYGNGTAGIWLSTSSDGFNWSAYTNTNQFGGDPAVVQNQAGKFYIIYTGSPYTDGISNYALINKYAVSIFPNPCQNLIRIKTTHEFSNPELKIFDVFGKTVYQSKIKNSKSEIHLDLPSGMYFMQVKNNNFVQTKKLEVIK